MPTLLRLPLVAVLAVTACGLDAPPPVPAPGPASAHAATCPSLAPPALPPAPRNLALDPDAVAMVDPAGARRDSPVFGASTVDAVPALRTTSDGRIGVNVKVGNDAHGAGDAVQLFLLRPESTAQSGVGMDPVGYTLSLASLPDTVWTSTRYPNHTPGSMRQVSMCSSSIHASGATDIYDLTLFGIQDDGPSSAQTYLMSLQIQVANAKQPGATITSVQVNDIHRGADLDVPTLLEAMIIDSGKLVVGRLGGWSLANHGFTGADSYNIVYAYLPGGLCSTAAIDQATPLTFQPILYAPYDPQLPAGHYGFAARPMRDARGDAIAASATPATVPDLSGTYPWLDRAGRNLFYYSIASKNQGSHGLRFPGSTCVDHTTRCFDQEYGDQTRGLAVVGSWTNGKVVLLDGMINNVDFGAGVIPAVQQQVPLYDGAAPVRFASGRDNGVDTLGPSVTNMTIVDALENLPNGTAAWLPRTQRDVVWRVSRGHISDEVAFDDFIDPSVFLNAPMNAVVDALHVGNGHGRYYDGYTPLDPACPIETGAYAGASQIEVQNAATRPAAIGRIPAYGTVTDPSNTARIEPAAPGGVHGRGLYLPPGAALTFPLDNPATCGTAQCTDAASRTSSWYFGLFVDTHTTAPFTLATIDGRLSLGLADGAITVTPAGGAAIKLAGAALMNRWTHVAFLYSTSDATLSVYADGLKLGSAAVPQAQRALLLPDWSGAALAIHAPAGAGIWLDDLKIILEAEWMKTNPEITCNHARGTIYRSGGADHCIAWDAAKTGTPKRGDYLGLSQNGVPVLHANAPRPKSFSTNPFCQTCHVPSAIDAARPAALRDPAIAYRTAPPYDQAKTDPRRQPMMPPRALTGTVPVDLYGPGLPAARQACPSPGDECNVDTYLLPP